jgi:ubiquinone/menaquinone biosynthesis C-methylase UbiE
MEVILGQGEHLPFRDRQFDIVLCLTALHNFHDPEKGLREMKRVGKKCWIITVFKRSADKSRTESLIRLIKTYFQVFKELDDQHDHIFLCNKSEETQ